MKFTYIISLCGLLLTSCAVNPVTGKKDLILLSEEAEIQMGREADPVITASFGQYDDPELQEKITRMGRRMASISHRPQLKYEFKILDSPVVNAFAVPGGYVYFTRGILAHFNSEAEFAGVLGHEIGHITARHSAKQYSNQLLFQAGLITGVIISPEFAQFSNVTQQAIGLLFLKFSRDNESQSDWLGVEYSTDIGYDAHQMADFFQTIGRLQPAEGGLPDFLSTHPNPVDRFENVHELTEIAQSQSDFETFKINREEYLDLIDGIVYGNDPRQGFVEDNVFYHPNGKYTFPVPSGWQSEISPQQVLFGAEDGEAVIVFGLQEQASLEEAIAHTVEGLQMTSVQQRSERVNGFDAIRVSAVQKDPNAPGTAYPFLMYFIQDGDKIYRSLGVTTPSANSRYASAIENTVSGFSRLTDRAKLDVAPERIDIVSITSGGDLATTLRFRGVAEDRLEELALINGMQLDERVEAGTRIKLLVRE